MCGLPQLVLEPDPPQSVPFLQAKEWRTGNNKGAMNVSCRLDLPILLAPVTRLLCLCPIVVRLPRIKLSIYYVS